jgi:uncharacterized membrane protein YbhN (UPF0104 family)
MFTAAQSPHKRPYLRYMYLIVCVVGLYGIAPELQGLHDVGHIYQHIKLVYLSVAILSYSASYLFSAATYVFLSFKRLNYSRTLQVQIASNFINHLLPAGIGGIGSNYAYLRKSKLTTTQAAATVSVNNLLGLIGHLGVLVVVLLLNPSAIARIRAPHIGLALSAVVILVLIALISSVLMHPPWRHRLLQLLHNFVGQIRRYRDRPERILIALSSSIGLTLCNAASLYFSAMAVGLHIGVLEMLIVFTIGVSTGTLTPTPGGLGGVEAGLVGGLLAYHQSLAPALATVLVYRIVTYWLALAVGAAMYVVVRRRGYL